MIEVTNKKSEVGFVIKSLDGELLFSVGGFDVKTTMFKSRSDANACINKHKLHRLGKVRIVSGDEIAEKYGKAAGDKVLWVIKNEEQQYLKYSAEKNIGYFFEEGSVGAVMFDSMMFMSDFIEHWQPKFNVSKLIPVLFKDDKEAI